MILNKFTIIGVANGEDAPIYSHCTCQEFGIKAKYDNLYEITYDVTSLYECESGGCGDATKVVTQAVHNYEEKIQEIKREYGPTSTGYPIPGEIKSSSFFCPCRDDAELGIQ